jgi:hypothetical protein
MFLVCSLTIATGFKTFHSSDPAAEQIQAVLDLALRKTWLSNKLAVNSGIGIHRPKGHHRRPVLPLATTSPVPASKPEGCKTLVCEPGDRDQASRAE